MFGSIGKCPNPADLMKVLPAVEALLKASTKVYLVALKIPDLERQLASREAELLVAHGLVAASNTAQEELQKTSTEKILAISKQKVAHEHRIAELELALVTASQTVMELDTKVTQMNLERSTSICRGETSPVTSPMLPKQKSPDERIDKQEQVVSRLLDKYPAATREQVVDALQSQIGHAGKAMDVIEETLRVQVSHKQQEEYEAQWKEQRELNDLFAAGELTGAEWQEQRTETSRHLLQDSAMLNDSLATKDQVRKYSFHFCF